MGNGSNIDTEEADVGWESLGFRRQTETTVEQFAELKHPPRNRYDWVSSALLLLLCLGRGRPISFPAIAAFDLRSNSGPPFFLRRPFLFFRHRNDYHTPFPTHFSLVRWISHFFFFKQQKSVQGLLMFRCIFVFFFSTGVNTSIKDTQPGVRCRCDGQEHFVRPQVEYRGAEMTCRPSLLFFFLSLLKWLTTADYPDSASFLCVCVCPWWNETNGK